MKVAFLITLFVSLTFATEEIKRARLEVSKSLSTYTYQSSRARMPWLRVPIDLYFSFFPDLRRMTIELSTEGEAVH